MEKADSNGFVNITWPSKSVSHGGIFHTKVAEPTLAQQQSLKVILEESKLTISQRRKSALVLREYEIKEDVQRYQAPTVRPRTSRRRSLSAIRLSGVLEPDGYRPPKRGEDRDLLKERLVNAMAYGNGEQKPTPAISLRKPPPKLPTNKEKWNDLVTQIRERAEWLAEMEELGEAGPHREMVKDQIAERLRALDSLGIDSLCSSARDSMTESTVMDCEPKTNRSTGRAAKSEGFVHSTLSDKKSKIMGRSTKKGTEENVMAYKFSPLQYSPRRRL